MSGNKPKTDPLERFFQRGAEDYHVPYREEDWLDLEKKLDHLEVRHAHQKRIRWMAAALLLIVGLLIWNILDNRTRIHKLVEQFSEMEHRDSGPSQEPGQLPGFQLLPDMEELPDMDSAPSQAPPSRIVPKTGDSRDTIGSLMDADEAESSVSIPAGGGELSTGKLKGRFLENMESPPLQDRLHPVVDNRMERQESGLVADAGVVKDIRNSHFSRLQAGILASPNITAAGSAISSYEAGYNIGFSLAYMVTSSLSVSTGMIYSEVSYSASESNYVLPAGYIQTSTIGDMRGECRILDIPVTLQYRLAEFDHSRIIATAGISTYIMLGEEYEFTVEGYNQTPELIAYRNEKSGARHWLSNAGLSVGYEWDLDRNWSVRAEPYVRIPISEVGWTRVHLYSVGTFFSVNYRM